MVGFKIRPPDSLVEKFFLRQIIRSVIGFEEIIEDEDDQAWIAMFESEECAILAQWILDLNGGKGV